MRKSKREDRKEFIDKCFHRYPILCFILGLPCLVLLPVIFMYVWLSSLFDEA